MLQRWFRTLGTTVVLCGLVVPGICSTASARPIADKPTEKKTTVPVFKLDGEVSEQPAGEEISFSGIPKTSLKDLVTRMKKAAEDPSVQAIVLLADNASIGTAQKEELRQAMAQFRAAGKEIYSHADSMQMGTYALLCGASRLSVVPTGDLWVTGMYGEAVYLRGLLDLLGVQPDFMTCGAYKSAAELFMRKEPSPEAHAMQNWLFDGIYETYVNMIAKGRRVDAAKVKEWIDNGPYTAEKAKAAGMIDAVEHRQEFEALVKAKIGDSIAFDHKYGQKETVKVDLNNPFAIFKLLAEAAGENKAKKSSKPAVGIVYVEGPIQVGKKTPSPFGDSEGAFSTDIRKALNDAAADDSIKAVVLRVNSPGGSAVASEIILDATKRVKAKKPFVVSMGDVAGSGGYYVACASDTIFADEATITASIGVVTGKLVTNGMWNKVGLTFTPYQRGKNAGMLASDHPFNPSEKEKMREYMDEIYDVFKGHVTAIRGAKLKKPIDELAGGRVFTGKQALEHGLVDKIGTMQDAVKFVAKAANVTDYEIRIVPEPKNILEQLMEAMGGGKDDPKKLSAGVSIVELAMPHLRNLDPKRLRSVQAALRQLEILRQEGVSMTMPAYVVP